jgi:lipopolysaccharide transport system permease protein
MAVDTGTALSSTPSLVIKPTRGWGRLGLAEVWRYRELVWFLTWREVNGRYRQMALGPLWIVIRPVVEMILYSLVFGKLANLPSDGVPYPLFTLAAIIPWTYFSDATNKSVTSLVRNMSLISKVYFPRLVIPASSVIAGLIDLAISFIILIGLMAFYGYAPGLAVLTLPVYLLLAACTALGVGLWNAALAVKFRDLQIVTTYGLQAWMFLTPVAYSAGLVPEGLKILYQLNPMYWVVEGFRWGLYGGGQGPALIMLAPLGLVALLLVSGLFVFRRTERTVVDLL